MAEREPVPMESRPKPGRWTIDVCKTCGRQAKWPFCEHRPDGYEIDRGGQSWCEPVVVREVGT